MRSHQPALARLSASGQGNQGTTCNPLIQQESRNRRQREINDLGDISHPQRPTTSVPPLLQWITRQTAPVSLREALLRDPEARGLLFRWTAAGYLERRTIRLGSGVPLGLWLGAGREWPRLPVGARVMGEPKA